MKRHTLTVLLAAALGCGMPAQAAWVQLCASNPAAAADQIEVRLLRPDGTTLQATLSEAPDAASPSCPRLKLDLAVSDILALHPLAPAQAAALGKAPFSLSGKIEGQRFLISDITPGQTAAPQAPPAQPLPLNSNLLDRLRATAFGAENRVEFSLKNGQLLLQCRPGKQPAGVVLASDDYRPRARSQLQLQGSASGTFAVITANAAQAASGSGAPVGLFEPHATSKVQAWPLEKANSPSDWRHWTLACPLQAARLQLDSLQLLPQAGDLPARASWVWQASDWQTRPDAVLAQAQVHGVDTLYLTIPLAENKVRDPARLAAFVRRAGACGVRVWAVDGDPNMARPAQRAATLARAKAYASFNKSVPPDARLQGVQFDVEPYLLPGYALAEPAWEQRYLELVKNLHHSLNERESPMALEMVVPFWWASKPALLDTLAPWVASLAVMDYRTDLEDIYRFAVPFLDWADRHGKHTRIALEAGPIAPENRYRYEKADTGELWQVTLGEQPFLLMLKQPRKNPHGPTFTKAGAFEVTGNATTFHANQAAMFKQLPALESMFSAWPGFRGMALHEVSPTPGLSGPGCHSFEGK